MDEGALLDRAIALALDNVREGGRPFGALVVAPDGEVVATGVNRDEQDQDPTAHAELLAIRDAARERGRDLEGYVVFASGEPCPMCQAAARSANISRIVYAAPRQEALDAGLGIRDDGPRLEHLPREGAGEPFAAWVARSAD